MDQAPGQRPIKRYGGIAQIDLRHPSPPGLSSPHMRPSKLTAEQEGEVYRRAKAGEPYASIQAWLVGQGVTLAKSSISEVIPRVERRALAAQPEAPPDEYIDPRTGAIVEISDAAILGYMQRSLVAEFLCSEHPRSSRLAAAKVVTRLMLARRKLAELGAATVSPQGAIRTNPNGDHRPTHRESA